MNYRSEIDGLRAIAVLTVVIFHINSGFLPGGFVGVDIFFVISGFLITSIINKQIVSGKFSFSDFYLRRIKRLLPLFLSVAIFSVISGYFILLPNIYRVLSRDIIASNLFLANFSAAIAGNYFDADKIKPLLHLWSLSVEEQFYIFFPALFLILYKYFNKYKILVLCVLFTLSLILAQWMSLQPNYTQYSYYLLPTRIWELMAGCILAIVQPNPIKKYNVIISISGIALILLGLATTSERSVFPGFITLLPILGSVLIIMAGKRGVGYLISSKFFLFIGVLSYSMYMWHWPLLVFFKVIFPDFEFTFLSSTLFLVILTLLSYLSKKYIEDFFRFRRTKSKLSAYLTYFVVPTAVIISVSAFIYFSKGMPSRYHVDDRVSVTTTTKCMGLTTGCFITYNKSEGNQVMLLGDSQAWHFSNLFTLWFNEKNLPLKLYASGGCDFYSEDFVSTACENIKKELKKEISKTKTIIIAKRFDNHYKDEKFVKEYCNFINNLTDQGHKIIQIKQVPKFQTSGFLEKWMQARRYGLEYVDEDYRIDDEYRKGNELIYQEFKDNKNIFFLDLNTLLLEDGKVIKYDKESGIPLYYDSHHLTAYGSEWIYNKIKNNKNYDWLIKLIQNED